MNLIYNNWNNEQLIKQYIKYLKSLKEENKVLRTKTIVNTKMPCLGISNTISRKIANEIKKGNLISYLDQKIFVYYETTIIYGYLIGEIKDFNLVVKYLNILLQNTDNWATVDTVPFKKIIKNNYNELYNYAKHLITIDDEFSIRMGIKIFFEYVLDDEKLKEIFSLLNNFYNSNYYYVNMVIAWFISHAYIRNKQLTLNYLDNHNLNKFTINKAIQKCRDSLRVSKEEKDLLLKYKV